MAHPRVAPSTIPREWRYKTSDRGADGVVGARALLASQEQMVDCDTDLGREANERSEPWVGGCENGSVSDAADRGRRERPLIRLFGRPYRKDDYL